MYGQVSYTIKDIMKGQLNNSLYNSKKVSKGEEYHESQETSIELSY